MKCRAPQFWRRFVARLRRRWVIGVNVPDVGECHLHRDHSTCPQCDGSHDHRWVTATFAPEVKLRGPGVPVRCRDCGARKCDMDDCQSRRHHQDAHIYPDGTVETVGGHPLRGHP